MVVALKEKFGDPDDVNIGEMWDLAAQGKLSCFLGLDSLQITGVIALEGSSTIHVISCAWLRLA